MTTQQFINRIRNCPVAKDIIRKFFIPVIKNRNKIVEDVEKILKDIEEKYCSGEYDNKDICAWFEFFADVGRLHRALELKAFWEIIFNKNSLKSNLSESLQLFVSNYAYMRQNNDIFNSIDVRIHGFIGAVCIDRNFNLHSNNWINNICTCYGDNLKRLRLNYYTNDTLNQRYNNNLLYYINNSQLTTSLVDHLLNLLCNRNIYKAYNFLMEIRGIGDKIACLFLRDISIIYRNYEYELGLYFDWRDLMYIPSRCMD
jgi:hypothetical protein